MTYSAIGAQLQEARSKAGLSVEELAVVAGFPLARLMQLESGWITPMAGELECLASHVGLSREALAALVALSADQRP